MILTNSPADILATYLTNMGLTTEGQLSSIWPVYISSVPTIPDNVVTIYDTAGKMDGASLRDGTVWEHFGVQIRVRSLDYRAGWSKVKDISAVMSVTKDALVTINGVNYTIHSAMRTTPGMYIGQEEKNNRSLFSINLLLTILQNTIVPLSILGDPTLLISQTAAVTMLPGQPVYSSAADTVNLAVASTLNTALVIGLTTTSVVASSSGIIQVSGLLTLPTSEWDAVAGTVGGLTNGVSYFLDPVNSGKITATPPSTHGQYLTRLGEAISNKELLLEIGSPVLL